MSVRSLASSNLTIKREGGSLKGKVSGLSASASLTISGTMNSESSSEVISLESDRWFVGSDLFETLTQIECDQDCTLDLSAMQDDGSVSLRKTETVVASTVGAISYRGLQELNTVKLGVASEGGCMIAIQYTTDFTPMVGDYIVDDDTGEEWVVGGIRTYRGGRRFHHWEILCTRREHSDPDNVN
jgi:hypothetical protein